jgi:putative peptidoglycan lipid II flippase
MFTQKNIIAKTVQIGCSTLASRLFGIVREILMIKYIGASGLSDAFLTAYKIPNSLRKIFAEGALSAAFVPTITQNIKHKGTHAIAGLMTLGFIFFEGIVVVICSLVMIYPHSIIQFIAPGFTPEQIMQSIPMIRILMPLIFFISSSALLAAALQAVGHFTVPAIAPIIVNAVFVGGIFVCLKGNFAVTTLCWFVLLGCIIHFLIHLIMYRRLNLPLHLPSKHDYGVFARVLSTFFLCLPSISLMEIALFIDTSFASLLKPGSISLLFYANRFVGIPLGIFAVAFSTILLPHFARVSSYSPKRLHFYLLESAKFIFWVIAPVALLMGFFSRDIFYTIFLSKKFTLEQVNESGTILVGFLYGLYSFSLNKILLTLFYSLHAAWIPAVIALIATTINILLNTFFITIFQAVGLAYATTISSTIQTLLFITILHKKYKFTLYVKQFTSFLVRYCIQLTVFSGLFVTTYYCILRMIQTKLSENVAHFLLFNIGLWFWIAPLSGLFFIVLWYTRKHFGLKLYFLE